MVAVICQMSRRTQLEDIIRKLEDEKEQLTAQVAELRLQLEARRAHTTNECAEIHPPASKPFFFRRNVNDDVGLTAACIPDLCSALNQADVESIEFHLYRQDFERWLTDVFQEYVLASRMAEVRSRELRGVQLRDELRTVVNEWLMETKSSP